MLVLTRKLDESISIGENIKITIVQLKLGQVRLGIEAPKEIVVDRTEIAEEKKRARRFGKL